VLDRNMIHETRTSGLYRKRKELKYDGNKTSFNIKLETKIPFNRKFINKIEITESFDF